MFDLPTHIAQSTDEQLKSILKKAVLSQNGEISRLMHRMGIKSKLNFGVPVTTLRQIALQYSPNHALALKLWQEDIREAKILASMLTHPELLTEGELTNICHMIDNLEYAELFSRDIFCYRINVDLLDKLVDSNYWQKICALYSLGWSIKKSESNYSLIESWFLVNIGKYAELSVPEIRQPLLFVMITISNISPDYRAMMNKIACDFATSDNLFTRRIGDEYLWLIETAI
jgi:hypothetical protein